MILRKAYRFKIKVNKQIEQTFRQHAGSARKVWNIALDIQKQRLEDNQLILSYVETCQILKGWKSQKELSFLKDAPSQVLQQKLKDLRRAFTRAFDPKSKNKLPRFKRRGDDDSFRYPQRGQA